MFNEEARNFQTANLPNLIAIINISPYEKTVLNEFKFIANSNPQGPQFASKRFYSYEYGIVWEEVNKELDYQLNGLKEALIMYLRDFLIREGKQNTIDCIKNLKPNHIITFNYTDTYEEYYKCDDIYHIHGDLKNGNIVLGYEDDNPKDIKYIKFKKYFQRIQNHLKPIDDSIFEEKDPFLEGLFEDNPEKAIMNNIVHVYGLSLDKTDEDLIRKIYDNADSFIVYYIDQKDYEQKVVNLIDILNKDIVIEDQQSNKLCFKHI